jgi:type I restriction enzyme S subunit
MRHAVPLPRGWAAIPLDDLGVWSGGGTPSKEEPSFWSDGRIPWVSPKDMKRLFIQDSEDHITEAALGASAAKLIPAHSVLMVTRSGILAHTFPVAVNLVPVTVNQDLKALTPLAGVRDLYVAYGLQALGQSILRACSKDGTTVASVDTQQLKSVQLPVAPHQEQHRIVEALESYMTRLDNAVALLERVEENLERYRASVLKAAVEGRLVATEAELARREGREYEPASELLKRILAERKARWIEDAAEKARAKLEEKARKAGQPWTAKDDAATLEKERAKGASQYAEAAAPETTDLPDLPEGWCWATAEAVSDEVRSITYGVIKLGDETPGGVPTLRSSNVRSLRIEADYVKPISPEIAANYSRTELRGGEILITVRGTLGGVALVPDTMRGHNISREVAMLDPVDHSIGALLALFVASPPLQTWMLRRTKGITYQGVNIETLKSLPIPVPPAAEQARISEAVERRLSVIEAAGVATAQQILRSSRVRQAILKWAFEGKLVEQDQSDEPASVLLERIKAERAGVGEVRPRARKRRSAQ